MLGRMGSHDAAARAGRPSRVFLADPGRVLAPLMADDPRHFQVVSRPANDLREAIDRQILLKRGLQVFQRNCFSQLLGPQRITLRQQSRQAGLNGM